MQQKRQIYWTFHLIIKNDNKVLYRYLYILFLVLKPCSLANYIQEQHARRSPDLIIDPTKNKINENIFDVSTIL